MADRRRAAASRGRAAGWLANTALALAATLLCLGALELVLRVNPLLVGDTYANGVLTKYTTRAGGIYYLDHSLGINFMIPRLTTRMYYNRHVWTHEADIFGFRNRNPAVPADVVLLGDSMVYGHGVDYEDTVGYILQQRTGLSVVNLARQGDCAFQEAYLLTEYLPVFRPRWILYHFFNNDIADLRAYLTQDQMRAFIATPVSAITFPPRTPVAEALAAREEAFRRRSWLERIGDSSYVWKLYRWARHRFRVEVGHGDTRRAQREGDEEHSLGWQYTRHALRYMQHIAARQGAALAIVPLTPGSSRHRAILARIGADLGLPVLDTRDLTRADASLWLPRDVHLSAHGARRLADIEAEYLRRAGAGHPRGALTPESRSAREAHWSR